MQNILFNFLSKNPKFNQILANISKKNVNLINGLNLTAKQILIQKLFLDTKRPIVGCFSSTPRMLNVYESINSINPDIKVEFLKTEEQSPYEMLYSDVSAWGENINILQNFENKKIDILLINYKNLAQILPEKSFFNENQIKILKKQEIDPTQLSKNLLSLGYKKTSMVTDKGEFSQRGDIIDIYPSNDEPLRMEFWGDEIESLRYFSPDSQRTTRYIQEATILPAHKIILTPKNCQELQKNLDNLFQKSQKTLDTEAFEVLEKNYQDISLNLDNESYFEGCEYFVPYIQKDFGHISQYFPQDSIIILDESSEIFNQIDKQDIKYLEQYNNKIKNGLNFPLNKLLHLNKSSAKSKLKGFQNLYLDNFISDDVLFTDTIESTAISKFSGNVEDITNYIETKRKKGYLIIICTRYQDRIKEILASKTLPNVTIENFVNTNDILICKDFFQEGFESENLKLCILTDTELFNRKAKKAIITKKQPTKEKEDYIESINDIKTGEYVVHLHHGIGIYTGLTKQEIDGQIKDYLTIEYAKGDKLHIPAEQINFLSRYRGSHQTKPILSRMGGADWEKTKEKVKKATKEIAIELLQLYAKRKTATGTVYSADTPWQIEMEDAFSYTETPDQLSAINDTKADMESEKIMDRLICGDVGFGKTEVAIRAIFKAITQGKQVAVLAPTTILAQQHYNTIKERFSPYPIKIDLMCRFKSKKLQQQTVKDLITGECDLVIGTHRLLQKDIEFKNLGMLVIDEEQRFGVKHKEKLKELKTNIDVLTLSATPIPRTLYMSLSGVRDMSLIKTPPVNRAPIKTFVGEYNLNYVKSAINYEIEREGQVYFLYNQVQSIYEFRHELQKELPNIRIGVAHGQMPEKELEEAIYNFSEHEYDVLLCTTIIESGLDIPNANTIIVYDADRFGLAQLYQIRGRVGRSERQAYAYCFYRKGKLLSTDAKNRLLAIKDFTTLGSGYQIAMRDLEIRGIGHILGHKQHGHMITVGFDTYCTLLEEAVKEVQGNPVKKKIPTIVDINITAYIDEDWVKDKEQKMIEYKRLSDVKSLRELELISLEWKDRFGKIPQETENLINLIKIRLLATEVGIESIRQMPDGIRIATPYTQAEWGFITKSLPKEILKKFRYNKAPATVSGITSYIFFNSSYLSSQEVFNILETLFYYIEKLQKNIVNN